MIKNPNRLLLVIAVIAALSIAGCGSDSEGGTSEDSITKAEFVKRADAICAVAAKAGRRAVTGGKDLPVAAAAALEREVQEIEDLPTPANEGAEVEDMLASVRQAIEGFEAGPKKNAEATRQLIGAEKRAKAYGLKSCWLS